MFSELNKGVVNSFRSGMVHAGGWFAPEPAFYIL